jgi:hypothetical protein
VELLVTRAMILLAVLGCSDRKPSPESEAADKIARADLETCRRLIPPALRARYLPALELVASLKGAVGSVGCQFGPPGTTFEGIATATMRGAEVSFTCHAGMNATEVAEIYRVSGEPVADLGIVALRWHDREVRFWDRDCMVDVLWSLGNADALPFARELDRELRASSIEIR